MRLVNHGHNQHDWENGWLEDVLNRADQAVKKWPKWMQEPEMRRPPPCPKPGGP